MIFLPFLPVAGKRLPMRRADAQSIDTAGTCTPISSNTFCTFSIQELLFSFSFDLRSMPSILMHIRRLYCSPSSILISNLFNDLFKEVGHFPFQMCNFPLRPSIRASCSLILFLNFASSVSSKALRLWVAV